MLVPGLDEGYSPENLVTKAYGKMCRMEVDVPLMITNDEHLQRMLKAYASQLRDMGFTEAPGTQAWIKHCEEGCCVDEVLMNAGIAALETGEQCVIMRSNFVSVVQSYVELFHKRKLGGFSAAGYCEEFVGNLFGGTKCKIGFIPLCIEEHWGFIMIQCVNGSCVAEGATVSWGDSMILKPDSSVLSGVTVLLRTVFPQGSFITISCNYFRSVLGWQRQKDRWSCGLYVLAIMRAFAIKSDFIPSGPIEIYDKLKLESIRRGCENAIWHTILTHLHLFGNEIMHGSIQAHIYCGLCIRKDLSGFVNDCITMREAVLKMKEPSRGIPLIDPIEYDNDTVFTPVQKEQHNECTCHEGEEGSCSPDNVLPRVDGPVRNGQGHGNDRVCAPGKEGKRRSIRNGGDRSARHDSSESKVGDGEKNGKETDSYEDEEEQRFTDISELLQERDIMDLLKVHYPK